MQALAKSFSNLEKIEWLPFHNLCVEKYQSMGIPFPLAGTDNMDEEALQGWWTAFDREADFTKNVTGGQRWIL